MVPLTRFCLLLLLATQHFVALGQVSRSLDALEADLEALTAGDLEEVPGGGDSDEHDLTLAQSLVDFAMQTHQERDRMGDGEWAGKTMQFCKHNIQAWANSPDEFLAAMTAIQYTNAHDRMHWSDEQRQKFLQATFSTITGGKAAVKLATDGAEAAHALTKDAADAVSGGMSVFGGVIAAIRIVYEVSEGRPGKAVAVGSNFTAGLAMGLATGGISTIVQASAALTGFLIKLGETFGPSLEDEFTSHLCLTAAIQATKEEAGGRLSKEYVQLFENRDTCPSQEVASDCRKEDEIVWPGMDNHESYFWHQVLGNTYQMMGLSFIKAKSSNVAQNTASVMDAIASPIQTLHDGPPGMDEKLREFYSDEVFRYNYNIHFGPDSRPAGGTCDQEQQTSGLMVTQGNGCDTQFKLLHGPLGQDGRVSSVKHCRLHRDSCITCNCWKMVQAEAEASSPCTDNRRDDEQKRLDFYAALKPMGFGQDGTKWVTQMKDHMAQDFFKQMFALRR